MEKPLVLFSAPHDLKTKAIKAALKDRAILVSEAWSETDLLRALDAAHPPDLVLLYQPPGCADDTLDLAVRLRRRERRLAIILLARDRGEDLAIRALKIGIKDYYPHPYSVADVVDGVVRCLAAGCRVANAPGSAMQADLIGESPSWRSLRALLGKLAGVDSNVLITGETGTGKEVAAEFIHNHSNRRTQALYCVNCAAIPDGLLESELFGYAKGAFTGAQTDYPGKLKLADGGTVFFDEIGDMSAYAQAKILRVIETRQVWPLGGRRCLPLDIRIIAATNRNLERMVACDEFRRDLYYRLNVGRVRLPPLRERKEDIPLLFKHFFCQSPGQAVAVPEIEADAMELLLRYDWPGNIRELKNLVEFLLIDPPRNPITAAHLPPTLTGLTAEGDPPLSERDRMLAVLESNHWNKSKAASDLNWSRMTLYRKMKKYAIEQRSS